MLDLNSSLKAYGSTKVSRLITKIKIKEIDEAPTLVSSHSQGNQVVSHGIQLSSADVA